MIMEKSFNLGGRDVSLVIKQDTEQGHMCDMCQKNIKTDPVVFANTCCHNPVGLCMWCFLKVIREFNINFRKVTEKNDSDDE